jgi:predicted PurR-regulated permease PerM
MSVYWLVALPGLRDFVLSLVPPVHRSKTCSVLGEIGQTMGGYVRGVALEATLIGAITFVALQLIGVEYALVLAVLASLGEIVPVVGPIFAAVPAIGMALLDSPTLALIVLGFYVGLQMLEGYLLFPLVVGKQSDIPPLLIIFGLLVGDALGSFLAVLVAIPLAGGLYVVVRRVLAPWLRRRTSGIEWPHGGHDESAGLARLERADGDRPAAVAG